MSLEQSTLRSVDQADDYFTLVRRSKGDFEGAFESLVKTLHELNL